MVAEKKLLQYNVKQKNYIKITAVVNVLHGTKEDKVSVTHKKDPPIVLDELSR